MLVPARVAPLCLFFAGILATPCLVEQHLCPVAAFDRGIGSHRGMAFALKVLRHVSTPLAVLSVAILLSASA